MSWSLSWENYLRALDLGLLPAVHLGSNLPHDISPHLTPFTPIELHAGYLLGKERIIATHSGSYGWVGERSLVRVCHFSSAGKLTATDFPTSIGTEARTAVTLQGKEAVVLERVPLSLKPNGKAEASGVRYGAEGIAAQLLAPGGGVLTVANGEFALRDGAVVQVRLGSRTQPVTVAHGCLSVVLPGGFEGIVTIAPQG